MANLLPTLIFHASEGRLLSIEEAIAIAPTSATSSTPDGTAGRRLEMSVGALWPASHLEPVGLDVLAEVELPAAAPCWPDQRCPKVVRGVRGERAAFGERANEPFDGVLESNDRSLPAVDLGAGLHPLTRMTLQNFHRSVPTWLRASDFDSVSQRQSVCGDYADTGSHPSIRSTKRVVRAVQAIWRAIVRSPRDPSRCGIKPPMASHISS